MRRLRKEDQVTVLAGRDKGLTGYISSFVGSDRVIVSGVNRVVKSTKAQRPGEPSGLIRKEAPIHVSNIAIVNPTSGSKDKVLIKRNDEGQLIRVFKSDESPVD